MEKLAGFCQTGPYPSYKNSKHVLIAPHPIIPQTYHDKLVKDTRDWHTAHEAWQSSLSRKGLSQYRKDLRLRARRRALRDVETGEIIKKLPNAFNIYFQETFPELKKSHPEETHKEIFARTSKSWTTLAESEKAVSLLEHIFFFLLLLLCSSEQTESTRPIQPDWPLMSPTLYFLFWI